MQIQLKATKVWLASEPVDFRMAINGLSALVVTHFNQQIGDGVYVFYNRARNRLKLLARHQNGSVLIYKVLDKNRFTLKKIDDSEKEPLYEVSEQQLSWLLAGLDWVSMSEFEELNYDDYF